MSCAARNSSSRAAGGESVFENGRVGRGKPIALDRHPFGEFVGESGESLLGARDRVLEILLVDKPHHLAQRIGRGDDVMVGECLDLQRGGFFFGRISSACLAGGSRPYPAAMAAE